MDDRTKRPLSRRHALAQTSAIVLAVLLLLLAGRLAGHWPRPLLVTVGGVFAAWLLLCSITGFNGALPLTRRMGRLIVPWMFVTATLLGSVYYVDRAGWLWFTLTGYNVTWEEELTQLAHASPAECLSRYALLAVDPRDDRRLIIRKGKYEVRRTVVIPAGTHLAIEPGVVLRFGAGCSLISYSPLEACGTADEPIVLAAANRLLKWGAIGLVGEGPSRLEHVHVEHARQAVVNGRQFLGGISCLETAVEIRHCRLENSYGKDALYVLRGRVQIHDNVIRNTFKDGLDLDGGTGEVTGNLFVDCGDEGIDLSDNSGLRVHGNQILDSRGGRIAAEQDLEQLRLANVLGYP